MKKTLHATSIRRRLLAYLSGGLLALWLATALASAAVALHEINEIADSQMSQLARSLMQVPQAAAGSTADLPPAGGAESSNNGFAIWDKHGTLLLADRYGREIPFQTASGFHNNRAAWQGSAWRYLYLHDEHSGRTVAVSQRLKERLSTLTNALWVQLALTFLSLPLLLWLIARGIRRGLTPLDLLAGELAARNAQSLQPVSEQVPAETLPLVQSLNALLARVAESLAREQRFTADAAHELRSPLAALKVQAEVLAMSSDEAEQQHHLGNIHESIDRANRLTEQLLTLARLDPMQALPDAQPIDWQRSAHQALQSVNLQAREKRVQLKLECACGFGQVFPPLGNEVLLQLMLRNLLDNAIRYSPPNSHVTLTLAANGLSVCDEGPGIAAEHLPRIRERFYRLPGQSQQGSGLGLSIVERIADLHGLRLDLVNADERGLCVHMIKAV
ncbi:MAG: sensor histidine kinase N-terminal domain-containing protein [Neisseria sp.]|jgi:two-component system sensor histidine kinase QseC|nr:sensor histidine kinase N-terminal domain-containing protein [Neisseria sp.]MBP7968745.1 sensor histidine kinase N-terminal domain-containing protein [Neisseria sp.]MBP8069668.1 sensor histidine kinase N-terminal domain-containing protein [Neisseria sp.]